MKVKRNRSGGVTQFVKRVNGTPVVREMRHNDFVKKLPAVRVDPETHKKVMDHLQKSGMPFSEMARQMIEGFLLEANPQAG